MRNKKAQVWIETVIYTLIGLSLIAIVLALVTPRINEQKDRAVIEQTISSLNALDSKINEVLSAPGNVRIVEMRMKRGEIYFDLEKDIIYFEIFDSRSLYSEPGTEIQLGRINVTTTEGNKQHKVKLAIGYGFNLTYDGEDTGIKKLTSSNVPYRISISHKGFMDEKPMIEISHQ